MTPSRKFGSGYMLGIDLGTTSVSLTVVSRTDGQSVYTVSKEYENRPSDDEYRLDADGIFVLAESMIQTAAELYPVASIGVTGQMHGIALTDRNGKPVSPFYTWQSRLGERKTERGKTVSEEIKIRCGKTIPTGYGINTYYALRAFGRLPQNAEGIATLPDLFVSHLTGERPLSHPTNAASLGAFDLKTLDFDKNALGLLGIPVSVLPEVTGDFRLSGTWKHNGENIPVAISIGDNQAGIFGVLSDERDGFINVGTSSQVSIVCSDPDRAGDVRPYFGGKYIVSGAGLCGGRGYAILKDFVASVLAEFGYKVTSDEIYSLLNKYAEKDDPKGLRVDARFYGTRNDPSVRGGISGIGPDGLSLRSLAPAFLRGIADELAQMYSGIAPERGCKRFAAAGNALRRCPPLVRFCKEALGTDVVIPAHTEEAAFGAALWGGIGTGLINLNDRKSMIYYI